MSKQPIWYFNQFEEEKKKREDETLESELIKVEKIYKKLMTEYIEKRTDFIKWIKKHRLEHLIDPKWEDSVDPDNKIAKMKPEDVVNKKTLAKRKDEK